MSMRVATIQETTKPMSSSPPAVHGKEVGEDFGGDEAARNVGGPLPELVAARFVGFPDGFVAFEDAGGVIVGEEDFASVADGADEDADDLSDTALEIAIHQRPGRLTVVGGADPDEGFAFVDDGGPALDGGGVDLAGGGLEDFAAGGGGVAAAVR